MEEQDINKKYAYCIDGRLNKVVPCDETRSLSDQRQIAYDSDTVIISNGEVYDPSQPETIKI